VITVTSQIKKTTYLDIITSQMSNPISSPLILLKVKRPTPSA